MDQRGKELAENLRKFYEEVFRFVQNCTEEDWRKVCAWEEWSVGVTARHIGAGHYGAMGLFKLIINGEKLPDLTQDQIIQMANQHARDHAGCTKEEVMAVLTKNGVDLVEFVAGLSANELDRTGYLAMLGAQVTAQQFIENVVLGSGGEHFANMKKALAA